MTVILDAIHETILQELKDWLEEKLINDIHADDPAKAGVIFLGHLQGDPDPDEARISVTLHANDPDSLRGMGTVTGLTADWNDRIIEIEMGRGRPTFTWARRFSVNARCLLEPTQESLDDAHKIAHTVRSRIESALVTAPLVGLVADTGECVTRGIYSLEGETIQSGGPDAYDFLIKVRFDVWTTEGD